MPSHYAITMPQLSDTMTEGIVVTWEKKPGERVSRGDIVATVETDKAIMDVEVFNDGYLAGPLAEAGATVPVGGTLGYISDVPGELAIPKDEVVTRQVSADIIPHDAGLPILMPQLSDTMTEGTVVTWEKALGDRVNRGDVVATVEPTRPSWTSRSSRRATCQAPWPGSTASFPWGTRSDSSSRTPIA